MLPQRIDATPQSCGTTGFSWFSTANERHFQVAWNTPVQGIPETPLPPAKESNGPITFALSERSIPSDYLDYLDISVTGLANGQSIRIERFYVNNGDGIINENAVLMDSRIVTDGFLPLIGEEPNYNETLDYIEVDLEAVTHRDGEIETYFPIRGGFEAIPGEYIYRVSSPSGAFEAQTQNLTITEVPTNQSFTGRVTSGGQPVPGALVGLLLPVGGYSHLIAVTPADETGTYTIYAPFEDEFDLVAVAPGYVGPFSVGSAQTIGEGETVSKDLTLTRGNRTISGTVIDSSTGQPIPGFPVTFLTSDESGQPNGRLCTHSWTDREGKFSVAVTADTWGLALKPSDVSSRSYLAGWDRALLTVDTTADNATDITLPLTRGECLISGYLFSDRRKTETGEPMPLEGVEVFAVNPQAGLTASGITYEDGWFNLAVTPGHWIVYPFSYDLAVSEHSGSRGQPVYFSATDQSIQLEIRTPEAGGFLEGVAETSDSQPIGKMRLTAYNLDSGNRESALSSTYESDGYYYFDLNEGTWFIFPDAAFSAREKLLYRGLPRVEIPQTDPDAFHPIQTIKPTNQLRLSLSDEQGQPIPGIFMHAMMTNEEGTVFDAFGQTDPSGLATVPVINGDWHVHLSIRNLRTVGKQELPVIDFTVNDDSPQIHLTAHAFTDAPSQLTGLRPTAAGDLRITGHGEPGRQYEVQLSRDLTNWQTLGLVSAIEGEFSITDNTSNAYGADSLGARAAFYRVTPLR